MEPRFQLLYSQEVILKDIPRLSPDIKNRIKRVIEYKLSQSPREFGDPLRHSFKGCWRLRIGDYRVVYRIAGSRVEIVRIGHRSEIYKKFDL